MQEHHEILRLAAEGKLPDSIEEGSGINMDIFEELYKAGLIQAIDACSFDGRCYMEPKITLAGRAELANQAPPSAPWWKSFDRRIAVLGLVLAVISLALTVALA